MERCLFDGNMALWEQDADWLFNLVKSFAEAHHGPLSQFYFESEAGDAACETGEDLRAPRERLCDGQRHYGGALERFFDGYWSLKRCFRSWHYYPEELVTGALLIGWSLHELVLDIPNLKGAISPIDLRRNEGI